MMPSLRSELRKLLTVRSTYILIASTFALIALFTYFGTSATSYEEATCLDTGEVIYSADKQDPRLLEAGPEEICGGEVSYTSRVSNDLPKEELLFNLQETVPLVATFVGIIVILLMAHEFRYFTINHTLTASNSRSRVLLSKLIISIGFSLAITVLAIGFSVLVTQIAIILKDLNLPAQDYDWPYIIMRHLGYVLAYSLFSLGVITLIRNLTAGILATFLLSTFDGIIGYLLSTRDIEPTKALPFSALERFGSVASDITAGGVDVAERFGGMTSGGPATVLESLAVVCVYLLGLWIAAWLLFLHRDAS